MITDHSSKIDKGAVVVDDGSVLSEPIDIVSEPKEEAAEERLTSVQGTQPKQNEAW